MLLAPLALTLALAFPCVPHAGVGRARSLRCASPHMTASTTETELDDSTWTVTETGLRYKDTVVGDGDAPAKGDSVSIHYAGMNADGTLFDSSRGAGKSGRPLKFEVGGGKVIPGWNEGVSTMKVGGVRTLSIPPSLGFGTIGSPDGKVKPNTKIFIECELVEVERGGVFSKLELPTINPQALAIIAVLAIPYFLPPGTLPDEIASIWGKAK
ncbi:hypothetical protein AB1Y20_021613 [Prymnesium parvum]|uniref:peptidylprolyl isomerase n=1 Tax=Prymnesium parvum TaxID=97485 RepID=A0AB34JL47_PRYPA